MSMKKLLFVLSTALLASIVMAQPASIVMPNLFAYPCPATVTVTGQISNLTPEQCQYATAMNASLPEGNYQQSCNYTVGWSEPGVISGYCPAVDTSISYSTLKITPSCQYVQNINGQLRCN
jgi:hypothetical protein